MPMNGDLSVYIHVPFCTKKCPYCHFYSVANKEKLIDRFVSALQKEIGLWRAVLSKRKIVSVYFGGGTPFLLGPKRLEPILQLFSVDASTEITIEANPETTSAPLLKAYRSLGINRLSIGAQSFSNELLKTLRRAHTADQTKKAVDDAVRAGWTNISLDLMYDIPGMDEETWQRSLEEACSLPIHHLSLYNLVIEANTAWFRKKEELERSMPQEASSVRMIQTAWQVSREHSFEQYEISAFAKHGFCSRHNTGYWQGREFLGFGPSAFSFFGNARFSNVPNIAAYAAAVETGKSPVATREEMGPQQRLREMAAIGLRMNSGISLPALERRWGPSDAALPTTLRNLEGLGLLERRDESFCLTDRGRLLYDTVAVEVI